LYLFIMMLRNPTCSPLFPYTTLFRSIEVPMLRSVFPRAHQKYLSLPLLGPITDGFDDWLTASGFTQGSRTLAIHLLPIADKQLRDRKSTRLNSSHVSRAYAVFCLKKK